MTPLRVSHVTPVVHAFLTTVTTAKAYRPVLTSSAPKFIATLMSTAFTPFLARSRNAAAARYANWQRLPLTDTRTFAPYDRLVLQHVDAGVPGKDLTSNR